MTVESAEFVCPFCKGIVCPYVDDSSKRFPDLFKELAIGFLTESANEVIGRINEHMNTPLDNPIPKGLVFLVGRDAPSYGVCLHSDNTPRGGVNVPVETAHSYFSNIVVLYEARRGFGVPRTSDNTEISSGVFRKGLISKNYKLLNAEGLDKFLELYSQSENPVLNFKPEEFTRDY